MKKKSQLEILTESNFIKPGIINNGIIKLYGLLKDHNFLEPADWFLQAYFGGELKRKDQEKFAEIANEEAYKLTLKNGVLICALSYQYHPMAKGLVMGFSALTGIDVDSDAAGWWAVGAMDLANIIRMGLAYKTKKSYAGISLNSLFFNSTSYINDLKNYIKKN